MPDLVKEEVVVMWFWSLHQNYFTAQCCFLGFVSIHSEIILQKLTLYDGNAVNDRQDSLVISNLTLLLTNEEAQNVDGR